MKLVVELPGEGNKNPRFAVKPRTLSVEGNYEDLREKMERWTGWDMEKFPRSAVWLRSVIELAEGAQDSHLTEETYTYWDGVRVTVTYDVRPRPWHTPTRSRRARGSVKVLLPLAGEAGTGRPPWHDPLH